MGGGALAMQKDCAWLSAAGSRGGSHCQVTGRVKAVHNLGQAGGLATPQHRLLTSPKSTTPYALLTLLRKSRNTPLLAASTAQSGALLPVQMLLSWPGWSAEATTPSPRPLQMVIQPLLLVIVRPDSFKGISSLMLGPGLQ